MKPWDPLSVFPALGILLLAPLIAALPTRPRASTLVPAEMLGRDFTGRRGLR
jgi:hypothetical protein